jgi:hypothetical protein
MIRPYLCFFLLLTAAATAHSQVRETLLPRQPTLS